MSGRKDVYVYSSTTRHRHRTHTAVSEAKSCIFVDMANFMIDGTLEVDMGKTVSYLLVSDAQDCQKDVSNGYQYLEFQRIGSSTKCNAKQK